MRSTCTRRLDCQVIVRLEYERGEVVVDPLHTLGIVRRERTIHARCANDQHDQLRREKYLYRRQYPSTVKTLLGMSWLTKFMTAAEQESASDVTVEYNDTCSSGSTKETPR